ncbi:MAG: hypothetical protein SFW67_09785 [Myxococcaceae bacterium]|nr:hypothetical protein [Myxococcaceae bacterium]
MSPLERRRAEALLAQTLAHAAKAPYYRRRWGRAWKQVTTLEGLARLPLLDKTLASRHQAELLTETRPPGVGIFSSGTTRGEAYIDPLHVPLTDAERAARARSSPEGAPDDFPGWTLAVIAVHHGLPRSAAGPDELRVPWLHDLNALSMLETVLRRPQPDGRRVTAMTVGSGPLKVFTAWLAQRGVAPRDFGVRLIGTYSYRLSPVWQRLIEARFDARVYDNYSLSELGTPFTHCDACGLLHMGHPPLAVEVLSLEGARPVRRGQPGRLIFTTLFPYTQVMPLIRYDSGDVGVEGPVCRLTGQRGYRVLGRRRHGLVFDEDFVLNPVSVRDVLEESPLVSRTLHPMARLGHVDSIDLGPPRWRVAREGRRAVLEVEVRFDPDVYTAQAKALAQSLLEALSGVDATTKRWARAGRVEVRLRQRVAALTERYD